MAMSRFLSRSAVRAASNSSSTQTTKAAGDISSVFPSLRPDYKPEPLPPRFRDLKLQYWQKNEEALKRSWQRLLPSLEEEVDKIKKKGSDIIPSVDYSDVVSGSVPEALLAEIRHRGTVVIRNVLPRGVAREYKERIEDYVAANQERVKAFPPESPAVYELYWTPSQAEARAHPNMLDTQRFLQRLWHSSDPSTKISIRNPLTYADRLRIRMPGDSKFTLGPHIDGGSLERWEDPEYARVYARILEGKWEEYDPWDAKHRVAAKMDLYNGAGACSMLRFFQGWLSMSKTAPGEGSLHVCPMIVHSTAYTILRPFFDPQTLQPSLDATFPGSVPGACQEYNPVTHPHLDLETTMVSVPEVEPGDFVAWHCDSLHSVDKEHRGRADSSVLYIPATPMCDMNVNYLLKQREAAQAYSPPWDFPGAGGPGETGFKGALDWNTLDPEGLRAVGMGDRLWEITPDMTEGERQVATLLLLASCVPSALSIYRDEVDHVDFHHALLGTPSSHSTFFLKPSSSSDASLLYTLSHKLLLGAINPRDGSMVWRQNVSRSAVVADSGILRASDGTNAMVSAVGDYISSWSALDGKLIWENWFADQSVADLELLELEDAASSPSVKDTIALFRGTAGTVRRLNGDSGAIKWEHKDESGDLPFQVSSSSTEVFYISLQSVARKGYKVKVTSLDLLTGKLNQQLTLNSEGDISSPESVLFVGANTASPVIAWADKSQKTLKVNVIGTKQVSTINVENTSGEEIRSIIVHAPKKLNSLPHFLVHYQTESSSWAEVYHINLQSAVVSKAYDLPRLEGWSVFSTSTKDANVYFTRITQSEMTVVSSASHAILGRWPLQAPPMEHALQAVSEVVTKGDSVAVRSAATLESGDWQLIRNGQAEWTRYEALAGALAANWAEEEYQEDLAHQLEVEGHESLYGAYVHRVKRHVKDLEHLPAWLKELPTRILTSFVTDEITNLDSFGISKPVIVATENGRVYALDSGNHGAVSWSVKAAETETWNPKAVVTAPGLATVYADDGSSVTLEITSGNIIKRTPASAKLRSVALLDDSVIGIREDGTPTGTIDLPGFLVTLSDDGRILGWSAGDNKVPVWSFIPPRGEKIIRATSRPAHDPVASIGKVLGNRSVLYKYLSPNLVLVTAVGKKSASFYLLDAVSGQILHASRQDGVDTTQPIASAISENWFAYSFWGDVTETSDAKGYQLVISELYESSIPNDRGPLGSAANYSSLEPLPLPYVVAQAYMIPEPISHMAVTQTRQGITIRQLLCTLPSSKSIVGIPRHVLDARRPVGRDPTASEAEEGLFKYSPYLEFDGKWYISHARDVAGIKNVLSAPTLLESTSLVFAYGSDIFATRATPSQAFDILGKGFSKVQLLLTIVALTIGVVVLSPMVRKKQIDQLWKAT
ncbi:hypothetical protein BDV25DRAFT_129039 [Aspergillus avenaceus]|uniref:Uncharacterized protein n=1 Tax=Aspergillus avenaceus TaxID=36643 RepID=A0A5N6TXL1_ASPAV|nr:hypothetical protein BDV25DRAFT_129039 [Aspergillus avenaceus]